MASASQKPVDGFDDHPGVIEVDIPPGPFADLASSTKLASYRVLRLPRQFSVAAGRLQNLRTERSPSFLVSFDSFETTSNRWFALTKEPGRVYRFMASRSVRGKDISVLSAAMEDYLRTIYVLGGQESPVNTTALAAALDVTPASVTGMIKRLAELKLVAHEPYRGVVLTETGSKVALEVLRHHRLIELYLAEAFGYSWDEVHEEADRLEHVISEELEARMFAALGHPTHDPHGDPIPTYEGDLPIEAGRPLTELGNGDRAVIRRVLNQDAALLRYLAHLGLVPQTLLEVVQVAPFEGPMTIRVNNSEYALGRELARQIVVDRIE